MAIDLRRTSSRFARQPRTRSLTMVLGVLGVLGGLVAPSARADGPSPEDVAAARMLGTEGVKLAASGDCVGAIPKLQAAEKLYHAPTTAEWLGECDINVGKIVTGTEILNGLTHEVLPPNSPPAFSVAQHKAEAFLPTALPKIAKLRIHVDGAPASKVTVTVDGEHVSSVLLDGERPTDPGTHQVMATAQGFLAATSQVSLTPGGSGSVSLKLEPDPNAAGVSSTATTGVPAGSASAAPSGSGTPGPMTGEPAPPPSPGHPNHTAAWVSFGVGGAGLVLGAITGFMALGTKGSLDTACGSSKNSCPPSQQSNIDSLNTEAWVSTVGFGVAVVGGAVGLVLLLTGQPSSEAAPPPKVSARNVGVTPWFSGNAVGLSGTFE